MSWHVLVDGVAASTVSVSDRGLLYGDGLFESVLVGSGQATLWPQHAARLSEGCHRLGLRCPDVDLLRSELCAVASGIDRCVVRITLTRGIGSRGYAFDAAATTRVVAAFPAPSTDLGLYQGGIRVRWCDLRLAQQPRLAGIKHLNRLEQVLARAEWSDPEIAEGLLLDSVGALVCATAANVFIVRDGELLTPRLDQAGVAGTCRAWIMSATSCIERVLAVSDVESADEVFIANSVRGILPVTWIGSRRYHPGSVTRRLMAQLHDHCPWLQPKP